MLFASTELRENWLSLRVGAVTFQQPSSPCSKCQNSSRPNVKEEMAHGMMGKESGLRGSENVVSSLYLSLMTKGPWARQVTSLSSGSLGKRNKEHNGVLEVLLILRLFEKSPGVWFIIHRASPTGSLGGR